ncbi:MAG: stage 0 sporulation family protein [Clostridia bacterium]|nr:stage 0 sporulation family protein [Clostridia bacterium]
MVNIVGVRFQNAGKLYFFDPDGTWPTPGEYVVVETARGIELGEVVTNVHEVPEEQLTAPLKSVIRVATAQDVQHDRDNRAAEKEAFAVCQRKIAEHGLDMKLVAVEYTFDNSKILFYFTANGRVDFRSLVKDLASVFRTRIELRQIGVRDEAKMIGGLGPCGRPICCGTFLGDFQPVSIKMAKEQSLSLNPTKISGICGRLMCCLKYEQDNYEQTRKSMPRVGKEINTPDGRGTVVDLHIIRERVRVRIAKNDSFEIREYTMEELRELNSLPAAQPAQTEKPPVQAEKQPQPEKQQPQREKAPAGQEERRQSQPPRRRAKEQECEDEKLEEVQDEPVEQAPAAQLPPPVKRKNNWREALEKAMQAAEDANQE